MRRRCMRSGLTRRSSTVTDERIAHLAGRLQLLPGDLLDSQSLMDAVEASRPDEVYNLAAQSFVSTSWNQAVLTGEFTGLGVTRMLLEFVTRKITDAVARIKLGLA